MDTSYIDFTIAASNGNDLLFLDDNDSLLLFWIVSWTDTIAKVWVKIPEIQEYSEKKICLLYGNSGHRIKVTEKKHLNYSTVLKLSMIRLKMPQLRKSLLHSCSFDVF